MASVESVRPKVLCVDDEPAMLRVMQRELKAKFDVSTTDSPEVALQLLDGTPGIVAVVSDWRLGEGADGLDLLNRVRQRNENTVRLLVSGNVINSEVSSALDRQVAHRFLGKPWTPGQMSALLESLLAAG